MRVWHRRLVPQVLEFNPKHDINKLLLRLSRSADAADAEKARVMAEQLFDNALIAAGLLQDPRPMLRRLQTLMEEGLRGGGGVAAPEDDEEEEEPAPALEARAPTMAPAKVDMLKALGSGTTGWGAGAGPAGARAPRQAAGAAGGGDLLAALGGGARAPGRPRPETGSDTAPREGVEEEPDAGWSWVQLLKEAEAEEQGQELASRLATESTAAARERLVASERGAPGAAEAAGAGPGPGVSGQSYEEAEAEVLAMLERKVQEAQGEGDGQAMQEMLDALNAAGEAEDEV